MDVGEIKAGRIWRKMGLTDQEYQMVVDALGRDPNWTELGMYAALWSEHCAYKHSRTLFHLFPTQSDRLLEGLGENAGIIDIGDGLAVCFKVESHNHPSAIEPVLAAATGVGGILRDIFAMGARPIAVLSSLRFGSPDIERVRALVAGVAEGISSYANTANVPAVGGEIYFHPCYEGNPLVNAMGVGVVEHRHIATASARGVGNPVLVAGGRTGRDGILGASFASAELDEASHEQSHAVAIGDPDTGKRLIEACLEVIASGVVEGIQDMGAAGLTSSSSEMAARAGTGIELDVALVPRKDEGMTPYEIMLSESQERMLIIPRKGSEKQAMAIFAKWGVEATLIGRVTDDGVLRVREGDVVVAEVPAASLSSEGAPRYYPAEARPAWEDELAAQPVPPVTDDLHACLLRLLASPSIASKSWVYDQCDSEAQGNTLVGPGAGDAAVIRITGSRRAIALTLDCNSRYCYLDPYVGAAMAVAEAARNVVCVGAQPLGITDGLNFGNPEKPEAFSQLRRAVEGISAACRALDIPVTGGNVSLYNETDGQAIYPTPIIGMLGLLEDAQRHLQAGWQQEGHVIALVGDTKAELGGSEYLAVVYGLEGGQLPQLDLNLEKRVQAAVLTAAEEGLLASAHDCSEGGLAVSLAECCILSGKGATIDLVQDLRPDAVLFGESPSRIVLSLPERHLSRLQEIASQHAVPCEALGRVGGNSLTITLQKGTHPSASSPLCWTVEAMAERYNNSLRHTMKGFHSERAHGGQR
ncbi:MAG: phosphoribosylformylglycinamidine synthase subunit PurL [Limnochordia bacterium]|jgi:phosphoribosylformylglycinamidine synthase II